LEQKKETVPRLKVEERGVKLCPKCRRKSMIVSLEDTNGDFREVWMCTAEDCKHKEPLKAWLTPKFELMRR